MRSGLAKLAVAASAVVLIVGVAGCSREPTRGRVLLVGIDGASLRVIEPLIEAGRLPNLARIAREGASGVLQSFRPLESPRIWTTIATGKGPLKHGIQSFTVVDEQGNKRLVTSRDRKVHALWNIASDAGLSVGVVNWWVTYPPEILNGVVISDHFLPAVVSGRARFFGAQSDEGAAVAYPQAWTRSIRDLREERESMVDADPHFDKASLPRFAREAKLEEWYLDDATVGALALQVQREIAPDLLIVLFKGVDAASHVLWASVERPEGLPYELEASGAERAAAAAALHDFYVQSDALLGELMAGRGPDDLVMVVSDHGFDVRPKKGGLTGQHRSAAAEQAILFARGRGIEPGTKTEGVTIFDITPTILHYLKLPIGADMNGRVAGFLAGDDPASVATHDAGSIRRVSASSTGQEERIMEQLEALGYFEAIELDQTEEPSEASSK